MFVWIRLKPGKTVAILRASHNLLVQAVFALSRLSALSDPLFPRPTEYPDVAASVTSGEIDAEAFGESHGGLFHRSTNLGLGPTNSWPTSVSRASPALAATNLRKSH